MAREEIQGEDGTVGGAGGDEGCAVCFACCGGMSGGEEAGWGDCE